MPLSWPDIPYSEWRETCTALHLWSQIIGKYRLAQTPWLNHSWHATLYVVPEGLTTGPVPDRNQILSLTIDVQDQRVVGRASDRSDGSFPLTGMSVSEFHNRTKMLISDLGGSPNFHGIPNEVPNPVAFEKDHVHRPYDGDAVRRFHKALGHVDRVFNQFRTGFIGKVSPSHLFWGSFDLAVTRFSGRTAPLHPGGIPALPDAVTREAYSHEVSSAGFWPGGGGIAEPMFYAYAYPTPADFANYSVEPLDARYDQNLGEFLLPYDSVRGANDPEATLLAFLETTYLAAANLGQWDRSNLEVPMGLRGRPRVIG